MDGRTARDILRPARSVYSEAGYFEIRLAGTIPIRTAWIICKHFTFANA